MNRTEYIERHEQRLIVSSLAASGHKETKEHRDALRYWVMTHKHGWARSAAILGDEWLGKEKLG